MVEEPVRHSERADLPPLDGAQYLSRFGITSQVVQLEQLAEGVAATIRAAGEVGLAGCTIEEIFARYGDPAIAMRHIDQVAAAVLMASAPSIEERNRGAAEAGDETGTAEEPAAEPEDVAGAEEPESTDEASANGRENDEKEES